MGIATNAEANGLRGLFPALANKTYFNYGGQGPLPTPSLEAITSSWRTIQELGPFTNAVWPFIEQETARVRSALAALCGIGPHRISLTENVTSGCVLPLWGLPWEAGDELLISDCEHPGVVAACHELARREGLSLSTLPVLELCQSTPQAQLETAVLEQLERQLNPQTRLVVLSHLLWNTGSVMPIAAVAERLKQHSKQPWLLVDAAQSMGSLPVEEAARAADIYAFTGHKWCCGPEGLGGVALSERVLEQAQPTLIGWRSLRNESAAGSSWHRDGRRFEVATSCVPLMSGLSTSLELLAAEGDAASRLETIRQRSEQLWQGLQRNRAIRTLLPEAPPAGLVSYVLNGQNSAAVVERLGQAGLWIRRLDAPDCLRACTHITTTAAEIEALLAAL
ncbi:MAG: aminotransferase class V-fold PLP-dependent enzyme [Vulcanococcus sp.]